LLLCCPETENNFIYGVHQVRYLFCLKIAIEPSAKTLFFFKKLDDGQSIKQEDCAVNFSHVLFTLFDFLTLKYCPTMSSRNYYSMLHNILEERRFHMLISWCRPWFGSSYVYLRQPYICNCQV
jgi:hypothetical protein